MDRTSGAEVGGPYASREDAQRAIERGGFDQSAAELVVMENDDDGSQDFGKTAAWGSFDTPATDASPGPGNPEVPELGQPTPDQSTMPKSTKPAQVPGGAGGLPQNPMDPQFDPASLSEPGPDPLASATASVVEDIRATNPGMDDETLIRVASRTVAKLVEADFDPSSMRPNIEDPMAHKTLLHLLRDVRRAIPHNERSDPRNRVQEWAERRFQQRRPDLFYGEEEGGQRTLFPAPQHQPAPPSRGLGPQAEPPRSLSEPVPGQESLFEDPDDIPDPPAPPQQPRRRRRPPRPRPLPGEFDPPQPPDLNRFDQPVDPPEPSGPQQQTLFDLPEDRQAARRLPLLLT